VTRRDLALAIVGLIACLGSPVLAKTANAQQSASPRHIGVLLMGPSADSVEVQAFRRGLRDAGYVEGRDVVIEWRFAKGDYNRARQLAAELVESKVDVIVMDTTVAAQAVKRTSTIPIVMPIVADPVGSGLVESLARPGGNITGISLMAPELTVKRLQLLVEVIPRLKRVTVLWNPETPFHPKLVEDLKVAASSLAIELSFTGVRSPEEFDAVFSAFGRAHAQALYVVEDAFFFTHRAILISLASKARLPCMYFVKQFPVAGGLMSYAPNLDDLFYRSAGYVDRILRGGKPGDLPIEQPTKFELVVNLKTAKALGLNIPESILLRADEVIR